MALPRALCVSLGWTRGLTIHSQNDNLVLIVAGNVMAVVQDLICCLDTHSEGWLPVAGMLALCGIAVLCLCYIATILQAFGLEPPCNEPQPVSQLQFVASMCSQ